MQTIGYKANGEASDWMLAERGIYAVSVEIASGDVSSKQFFINDPSVLKNVLLENEPWISSTMDFLLARIICHHRSSA